MTTPPPLPLSSFIGASSRDKQRLKRRQVARDDLRSALGVIALEGIIALVVTLAAVPANKTQTVRIALAKPAEPLPIAVATSGGPLRPSLLLANLGPAVPAPSLPWRPLGGTDYALAPQPGNANARRGEAEPVLDTGHVAPLSQTQVASLDRQLERALPAAPLPARPDFALAQPEPVLDPARQMAELDRPLGPSGPTPLTPGADNELALGVESETSETATASLDLSRDRPGMVPDDEPLLLTEHADPATDPTPEQALDRDLRQPELRPVQMAAALDPQIGADPAQPSLGEAQAARQKLDQPNRPSDAEFAAGLELVGLTASWESPERETSALHLASRAAPQNATQLSSLFDRHDYSLDTAQSLPPVFVNRLPTDMAKMTEPEDRKDLFLRTLLPLIAQVNERTMKDRERLQALAPDIRAGHALKPADEAFVSALADDYGALPHDVDELLRRVDAVPPSLALAQAAQETGWGTSHPAQDGNALFGEMAYVIVSEDNHRHAVAKVRRFDDLASAVGAYIRNLNTHRAYADFRAERAKLRVAGKQPDGHALAPFIQRYSERGPVYTQMLRSLIQWNNLTAYDGLRLDLSEQSAEATSR